MVHLVNLQDHDVTRCGLKIPTEGEEALFDVLDFHCRMSQGAAKVCQRCAEAAGLLNTSPDVEIIR